MIEKQTTINFQDIFPTRVWFLDLPDHTKYVTSWIKTIEELERKIPEGVKKSNVGGWQSDSSLFQEEIFEPLSVMFEKVFRFCFDVMCPPAYKYNFSMQAWANINSPGNFNKPHVHSPSLLSAVYYLKVPVNSGSFYFRDPRAGAFLSGFNGTKDNCPPNCTADAKITPKDGLVLVFPSWLEHGVEDHNGIGTRISIAVNASHI
jgi:uncharacterized protein (TIGR02466 family)